MGRTVVSAPVCGFCCAALLRGCEVAGLSASLPMLSFSTCRDKHTKASHSQLYYLHYSPLHNIRIFVSPWHRPVSILIFLALFFLVTPVVRFLQVNEIHTLLSVGGGMTWSRVASSYIFTLTCSCFFSASRSRITCKDQRSESIRHPLHPSRYNATRSSYIFM